MTKKGHMERGSASMGTIFEMIAWAMQDESVEFVAILVDRGEHTSQILSMPSEKRHGDPLPLHEIQSGLMKAMEILDLNMGVDKPDVAN